MPQLNSTPSHKRQPINIDGCDFWEWHVIKELPRDPVFPGRRRWLCRCSCGNIKPVQQSSLLYGGSRSCGHESRIRKGLRNNKFKHGMAHKNIWNRWWAMLRRCSDPNVKSYRHYGGRGIKVCKRWLTFERFYADMGEPPFKGASLDRIDNDGDYSPENVRWADKWTQGENRTQAQLLTINGESKTLGRWAHERGLSQSMVRYRFRRYGWTLEEALEFVPRQRPPAISKNR